MGITTQTDEANRRGNSSMNEDLDDRWNRAMLKKNTSTFPVEKSDWERKCSQSIQKEMVEIAKRCNIRIGQTEIYCSKCSKSWGFGNHTCQDIRLKRLNKAKIIRPPIPGRVYAQHVTKRCLERLLASSEGVLEGYGMEI